MADKNPSQMSSEEKMNELLENQRELLQMQQLNNLLLVSQNPNIIESIRETAKLDALALLSNSKFVSEELSDRAIKEWYRLHQRQEELKTITENQKESELASKFK